MDVNKILNADILDIIFEGKNKEYGAYDLRKTYNRRLLRAIIGTSIIILLLFGGFFLSNLNGGGKKDKPVVEDVQLARSAFAQCRPEGLRELALEQFPWLKSRLDHLRLSELRDTSTPRREQTAEASLLPRRRGASFGRGGAGKRGP